MYLGQWTLWKWEPQDKTTPSLSIKTGKVSHGSTHLFQVVSTEEKSKVSQDHFKSCFLLILTSVLPTAKEKKVGNDSGWERASMPWTLTNDLGSIKLKLKKISEISTHEVFFFFNETLKNVLLFIYFLTSCKFGKRRR